MAADIVDQAINEEPEDDQVEEPKADDGKNPAAVALCRLGGLKGGAARAATLTKKQRSESARKAVKAQWAKRKQTDSE